MDDDNVDPTVDRHDGLLGARDSLTAALERRAAETRSVLERVAEKLAAMAPGGDEQRNLQRALVELHAECQANVVAFGRSLKAARVTRRAAVASRRVGRPRRMLLVRPRAGGSTVCRSRPARRPKATRAGPGDDDGPPAPALGHAHEAPAVAA